MWTMCTKWVPAVHIHVHVTMTSPTAIVITVTLKTVVSQVAMGNEGERDISL